MLRAVQMGLHSLLSGHLNMTSLAKEFLVIREFRSLASSPHFFHDFSNYKSTNFFHKISFPFF
jgi:hypothetical protein